MHGGKTPGGVASPHFKTGRYSKFLPDRLVGRYQEAVADSELLSLAEEVALVDSRLADLLGRVDSGEAGAVWGNLRRSHQEFLEAQSAKDSQGIMAALSDLDRLIARGQSDYATWHEVTGLIEQRRKLVESEQKRRIAMQNHITAEQALLLVGALLDIIRTRVDDRTILADIQRDVNALITTDSVNGS